MSERIRGNEALVSWFGDTPDFHDCEVTEVRLARDAASYIRLRARSYSGKVDEHGVWATEREAVVTFVCEEVLDVALQGFSPQNVISWLDLEERQDSVLVVLAPAYGLSGSLEARRVSITVEPTGERK